MSSFADILRKLEQGELPEELDFRKKEQNEELDWSKIQYNTFYKSDEYILERFPNSMAFQNLPGSNLFLDEIRNNITTPLQEIEERQKGNISTSIKEDETDEKQEETQSV